MIDDKDKIKNDDSEPHELSSELNELNREWCYYSGMPSTMAYMNLSDDEEEDEDEHKEDEVK